MWGSDYNTIYLSVSGLSLGFGAVFRANVLFRVQRVRFRVASVPYKSSKKNIAVGASPKKRPYVVEPKGPIAIT